MTKLQEILLHEWLKRLQVIYRSLNASAASTNSWHYKIGVLNIILSASVSMKLLLSPSSDLVSIAFGVVGLFATCLTAIQTFLKLPDQAERFKEAGAKFSSLHREVEHLLISPALSTEEMDGKILGLRKKWSDLALSAPTAQRKHWLTAKKKILPNDISVPEFHSLK